MALQVYRCSHCGREVLVRIVAPLTEAEIRRRVAEEMQPETTGPPARPPFSDRLREDIWTGISTGRTHVPREEAPESCPACGRAGMVAAQVVE